MDELISRQAAIDALGEEPLVWYDGENEIAERNQWERDIEAIKQLPPAQPTFDARDTQYNLPIGTGLISRAQAIDAVNSRKTAEQSSAGIMRNAVVDFCVDIIKKLPSAQPKRGKWQYNGKHGTFEIYTCDKCGWNYEAKHNYCPNCGAKMEVTE